MYEYFVVALASVFLSLWPICIMNYLFYYSSCRHKRKIYAPENETECKLKPKRNANSFPRVVLDVTCAINVIEAEDTGPSRHQSWGARNMRKVFVRIKFMNIIFVYSRKVSRASYCLAGLNFVYKLFVVVVVARTLRPGSLPEGVINGRQEKSRSPTPIAIRFGA